VFVSVNAAQWVGWRRDEWWNFARALNARAEPKSTLSAPTRRISWYGTKISSDTDNFKRRIQLKYSDQAQRLAKAALLVRDREWRGEKSVDLRDGSATIIARITGSAVFRGGGLTGEPVGSILADSSGAGVVSTRSVPPTYIPRRRTKRLLALILAAASFLCFSCRESPRPTPVPQDRQAFVGKWKSNSGFVMTIRGEGTADLSHGVTETYPDFDRLCIKVSPREIKGLLVNFPGTDTLEVSVPLLFAKETGSLRRPVRRRGNGRWS
jgi:hypothetical protein